MEHVVPTFVVLLVVSVAFGLIQRRYSRQEQRLLLLGFLAHIVSAFLQVWITREVFLGGDMLNYEADGHNIARAMEMSFGTMAWENVKLIFQMENDLPLTLMAQGNSTGTMCGIAGFLLFALGDSLYACCVFLSALAFFGSLAMYEAYRARFPRELHTRLVIAMVLVPSVVYWGSAMLKETVVMVGLGWMVLGLHRLLQGRFFAAAVMLPFGAIFIWVTKAYVLFPFILAGVAWIFWEKMQSTAGVEAIVFRPVYFVIAAIVGVLGVVALGNAFPDYSIERFGEEAARYQDLGQNVTVGGSNYEIGDSSQRTLLGQLAFAPFALFTVLFRPLIFEVHNVLMVLSAAESAWLFFTAASALFGRSWKSTIGRVKASPLLVFSLVFTLTMGIAVGLTTTNLGTLVRYRMPLMPFYVAFVLVLAAPQKETEPQEETDASLGDGEEEIVVEPQARRRGRA